MLLNKIINFCTSTNNFFAISLAILCAIIMSIDAIVVRFLSKDINPFVVVFFRTLFGLFFFIPFILRNKNILHTNYCFMHVIRAVLKIFALVAMFLAIKYENLMEVTSISFTSPLFLIFGAVLILKEDYNKKSFLSAILGFFGVVVIMLPGLNNISFGLLWAVLGAILIATIQLILKKMLDKDKTETLVAWNLILMVILASIPAYIYWVTPTLNILLLLIIQGSLGAIAMSVMTKAFSLTNASLLAPIDFIRLPMVTLIAFIIFNEIPSFRSILGAFMILLAVILITINSNDNNIYNN